MSETVIPWVAKAPYDANKRRARIIPDDSRVRTAMALLVVSSGTSA
jgi:hypothetical protein